MESGTATMNERLGRYPYSTYATLFSQTLFEDVIPFWEKHSIDCEAGGYFTCLDREGRVFDTDKFVWLQARQVWTFSMLYNRVERKQKWLDIARTGADFLAIHGRDSAGDWYFSLDRHGRPLIQPHSIFSDCFAAMAFCQYGIAADDSSAKEISLQAYRNVLRRRTDPKGKYSKAVPGARPFQSLAVPMILANLAMEMEPLIDPSEVHTAVDECIDQVMKRFLDPERGIIHEHILEKGELSDSFEGRLINPGHTLEAMWFLMDIAQRRGNITLLDQTIEVSLRTLELGWDEQYGGIFYFIDSEGKPPQQLEWDQKLWWVHTEALVALSMAFSLTQKETCWNWFERVHAYTWKHFPDPTHGEWFGYLNRRGEPLLHLKGGKWKGCFHVPRALYRCWRIFEKLQSTEVAADPQHT